MQDPETQVASYFARYEPAMAKLGKALRAKLRARLPGLSEIVYLYENQHSLVISYSPSERGYEGLCSLALYPDKVHLYFTQGAALATADPDQLLQGRGKTVRHVVIGSLADFERPQIEGLLAAALQLAKLQLDPDAKGAVVIKAEAQKQRASRAAKAPRTAAPPRKAKPRR